MKNNPKGQKIRREKTMLQWVVFDDQVCAYCLLKGSAVYIVAAVMPSQLYARWGAVGHS